VLICKLIFNRICFIQLKFKKINVVKDRDIFYLIAFLYHMMIKKLRSIVNVYSWVIGNKVSTLWNKKPFIILIFYIISEFN